MRSFKKFEVMKNVHHRAKGLKIKMKDEGYNLTVELNNIKITFTVFGVSEQGYMKFFLSPSQEVENILE